MSENESPIKCYYGQVIFEIRRPGREWLIRFFVSKDLHALTEYIRKTYRDVEIGIEVSFEFKDDDGFIELCFDDEKCPKGWSVRPHQDPTRVRQTVIDRYGSMSPPRFPECLFTIIATPGEGAVKELSYPVILKGIKESNVEKINIVLTMGDFQQASAGSHIALNSGPIFSDDEERKLAGEVLQENFDTLSDILAAPNNLSAIIMSLYAKKLISDTTATECMNDGRPVQDRCASLLFALKVTIDGKPQAMVSLIEVLKGNEAFKEIAYNMELEVSYSLYAYTFDDREEALRKVEENVVTYGIDRQRKIETWLKEGEVELEITRINMHGAPGAGKTCSQYLLLNEPPPAPRDKLTDSTPIACPAVKATRISIDGKNKKWERVKEEDLLNQLAYRLNEEPNETQHKKILREAPMPTNPVPVPLDDSSPKAELSEKKPLEKKPTDMEVIKEIVHALEAGKFEKLSSNWVYFIDSGGQPAYRELLPLFTRAAALNIITIDLTKGLDEKFEFQYRFDQFEHPINQRFSNCDIIQSAVSSGAMFNPIQIPYISESDKDKDIHPRYFVLGTRKDKLEENGTLDDELNEMNKKLLEEYKANKKVIKPDPQNPGNIIYPVNTMLKGPEREKASIALCTKISSFGASVTTHIPIRLFAFEISLQREAKQKNRSFLTKKEVIEIGKSLQLDDESDIDKALQYLHNVTIILYYCDVLPNIIFVDPKPILDVLSLLIASTYTNRTEADNLRILGLFNEDLLQLFGKKIFEHVDFKSSHMIKLLIHLHIIAEAKNRKEGKYFFPCALPSCKNFEATTTEIQPLLIAWEIDNSGTKTLAIPQGLFSLTIVHLLEQKGKVDFCPADNEYYRYNDAMSLRVYKEYTIDIINRYTHIEIRLDGDCKDSCPQIRKLVTDAIEESSDDLKVGKNYILAFKCPSKNEQCYCIVQEDKSSTRCTRCRSHCKVLQGDDNSYRCWFSDYQSSSPATDASPVQPHQDSTTVNINPDSDGAGQLGITDLNMVQTVLKEAQFGPVNWNNLGLKLGLYQPKLNVIANSGGDADDHLRKTLEAWLEGKDNATSRTWKTLIDAVRETDGRAAADEIPKKLKSLYDITL